MLNFFGYKSTIIEDYLISFAKHRIKLFVFSYFEAIGHCRKSNYSISCPQDRIIGRGSSLKHIQSLHHALSSPLYHACRLIQAHWHADLGQILANEFGQNLPHRWFDIRSKDRELRSWVPIHEDLGTEKSVVVFLVDLWLGIVSLPFRRSHSSWRFDIITAKPLRTRIIPDLGRVILFNIWPTIIALW